MLMLITALMFLTLWLILYSVISMISARRQGARKRLEDLSRMDEIGLGKDDQADSFGERVIRPMAESVYGFVQRLSPESSQKRIESSLRQAGRYHRNAVQQWMALRWLVGGILPVVGALAAIRITGAWALCLLGAVVGIVVMQMLMTLVLVRGARERKDAIQKQLPDVLDVITVSVEAGLSFDGAVERVVAKMNSALGQELGTALKEMRMGKTRRQALKDLSDRCQVADLTTWTGAMIQADELGVGIGNVLRIQSGQMREKRRQRAREKSMQAPIKILFPLIFFIFPSIFVVLVGPAMIQIIAAFSK